MTTYWEKLKDPRWQKKRLEIMQRDDFTCLCCCSAENTLNVHHGYYEKGLEPWEYDDDTLHTLCEDCHKSISETMRHVRKQLGRISPIVVHELGDIIEKLASWGSIPEHEKRDSAEMIVRRIAYTIFDPFSKDWRDLKGTPEYPPESAWNMDFDIALGMGAGA